MTPMIDYKDKPCYFCKKPISDLPGGYISIQICWATVELGAACPDCCKKLITNMSKAALDIAAKTPPPQAEYVGS